MNNWTQVRAADFVEFNPRLSIKKGTMATKVGMDKLQPFTKKIPATEQAEFAGGSKFCNGDTIMARITPCLENGKTAFVDVLAEGEVAFGSTEFIVMRAKADVSDPQFVYYLATSPAFRNVAIKSMVGSSGRQRVQQSVLDELELTVPPLEEQKKIGNFLAALDQKIAQNNQINDNLEEQISSLFINMFGSFIDSLNDGGVKLGDLIESVDNRGKTPPLSNESTSFPIIDVKALSGNSRIIDYSNCTKYVTEETYKTWFRSGHPQVYDILISTVGSLAEMKLFFGNKGCIAQNVVGLRSKGISPLYLYQYLSYIKNDLVSYNIGSVQPSIKVTHIIKHPVYVATQVEIEKFDNIARSITEQIFTNCKENEVLKQTRDALLPKLMSGEIDLSNIDI